MAGFQFAHIQTYSRKGNAKNRSLAEVLAENSRAEGAAPHVENPKKPEVIYGCDPLDLVAEIDRIVKDQKTKLVGTGKKIREDTHLLMTAVLSNPIPTVDLKDPEKKADYEEWRADAISFIKEDLERRGYIVKAIVEHTDEEFPHLHVLAVADPEKNPRLDAKLAHPGYAAKAAAAAAGASVKDQTLAYKSSMRDWQDKYFDQVSMKHGHARLGPGRRRLTRGQWKDEQSQFEALSSKINKSSKISRMLEKRAALLTDEQKNLDSIKRDLDKERRDLQKKEREIQLKLQEISENWISIEAAQEQLKIAAEERIVRPNNIDTSKITDQAEKPQKRVLSSKNTLKL